MRKNRGKKKRTGHGDRSRVPVPLNERLIGHGNRWPAPWNAVVRVILRKTNWQRFFPRTGLFVIICADKALKMAEGFKQK